MALKNHELQYSLVAIFKVTATTVINEFKFLSTVKNLIKTVNNRVQSVIPLFKTMDDIN